MENWGYYRSALRLAELWGGSLAAEYPTMCLGAAFFCMQWQGGCGDQTLQEYTCGSGSCKIRNINWLEVSVDEIWINATHQKLFQIV